VKIESWITIFDNIIENNETKDTVKKLFIYNYIVNKDFSNDLNRQKI